MAGVAAGLNAFAALVYSLGKVMSALKRLVHIRAPDRNGAGSGRHIRVKFGVRRQFNAYIP
jgi:hypothetical protein